MQSGNYGNNYCMKCGNPLQSGNKFCTKCGNDLQKNDGIDFQNTVKVNYYAKHGVQPKDVKPVIKKTDVDIENYSEKIKVSNLIITIICGILWLVAPFEAINILTLGEQPSAFQLVTGEDLLYLGELVESTAFWAALVSIIGISVCFIATLTKSNGVCRAFAIISVIPMMLTMFEMFMWAEEMEYFVEVFGFGYWAILILLFVLIFNSGGNKRYD